MRNYSICIAADMCRYPRCYHAKPHLAKHCKRRGNFACIFSNLDVVKCDSTKMETGKGYCVPCDKPEKKSTEYMKRLGI
jgi:hypothetical protein